MQQPWRFVDTGAGDAASNMALDEALLVMHEASATLPTLLIWGDQDIIVDRDATTRTLIAIPGANNLEVLHGVGHSPMLEAPQRLAEIYVNFITQDFAGFDAIRDTV